MFCHKNALYNRKRISQFWQVLKKQIVLISANNMFAQWRLGSACASPLFSLCYLDEEAVYLIECVVKSN